MLANDMRKGDEGRLLNGWKFRIEDNRKGLSRLATVWGYETEIGSVYVHDIAYVDTLDGRRERIELSKAQAARVAAIRAAGF